MLLEFTMGRRSSMIRTYDELRRLNTFEERFEYLRLNAIVGDPSFGFDRYVNQNFYKSKRWRSVRNDVIIRDNGCDLGIEGYEIPDKILIHHITPITLEQLEDDDPFVYDLNNLICTSFQTHQAIHFGDIELVVNKPIKRYPGDTILW